MLLWCMKRTGGAQLPTADMDEWPMQAAFVGCGPTRKRLERARRSFVRCIAQGKQFFVRHVPGNDEMTRYPTRLDPDTTAVLQDRRHTRQRPPGPPGPPAANKRPGRSQQLYA